MATITITKQWANGQILLEADLDFIKSDIETFINVTKLNDDNIQNAGITASSKLIDGTISTGKLQNAAVTDTKLATNAVTTIKITDANVTAAKLAADVFTTLIPIGSVWPFAGASAPSANWLLCDGSIVAQATYVSLFALISTTYNTGGEGAGNFRLPDIRGRVIAGQDDMGGTSANRLTNPVSTIGGIDGDVLGGTGGAETHVITEAQLDAHTHSNSVSAPTVTPMYRNNQFENAGLGAYPVTWSEADIGAGTSAHAHTVTIADTGSSAAHNNVQPTIIMNYIIRAL